MKPPEKSAADIAFIDLVRVLLEPVRSAEPPIISGSAGIRLSSANSQAVRVAISFGAAASDSFTALTAASSAGFDTSPFMRRVNSACWLLSSAAKRLFQSACAPFERSPALRHWLRISAGTSNGAAVQPSASRAPLISSAPSGEPCEDDLPALVGAPKPMVVLQAIMVGRSDFCAWAMADAIACGSWPSTRDAVQPQASKR